MALDPSVLPHVIDNASIATDGGVNSELVVRAVDVTGGSEKSTFDFLTANGTNASELKFQIGSDAVGVLKQNVRGFSEN